MIKCGSCQYEAQASADFVPSEFVYVWVGAGQVIDFPVRRYARQCVWCWERANDVEHIEKDHYWYASA